MRYRSIAVLTAVALGIGSISIPWGGDSASAVPEDPAEVMAQMRSDLGLEEQAPWVPEAQEKPETKIPDLREEPWTPSPELRDGAPAARSLSSSYTAAPAPGLGSMPYFTMIEYTISDREQAQVNVANGNLFVSASDLTVASPGVGIDAGRIYNSLATSNGGLGGGWLSTFDHDDQIGLVVDDAAGTARYHTENQFVAEFNRNDDGDWIASPGTNMKMTARDNINDDDGLSAYTITVNKTGEKTIFDKFGERRQVRDRNGVGLTYYLYGDFGGGFEHDNGAYGLLHYTDEIIWDSSGRRLDYSKQDGRLSEVTLSDLQTMSYAYDDTGLLSSIGVNDEFVTDFSYDADKRISSVAEGRTDSAHRLTTTYAYSDGQTVVTDPNGNATTYEIDDSGRVTKTIDALGRERSQTWTSNSDVQTATDAFGTNGGTANVTSYEYDDDNNQTSVTLPTGAAASALYAQGAACEAGSGSDAYLPKCALDDAGNSKKYDYDDAGNLTKVTNTSDSSSAVEQEYVRETSDRSVCGAFSGQVCSSKDGNGNITAYSYDASGNVLSVTPPAPMGDTTYTYDLANRVTSATDGNGNTTTYTYTETDRLISQAFSNGETHIIDHDARGQVRFEQQGTDYARASVLDEYGRIDNTHELAPSLSPGPKHHMFTLDDVGNITGYELESAVSGPAHDTSYTYDAANQLVAISDAGVACDSSTAPAAGANCVTLTYDANGKETKRSFPGGAFQETTRDKSGRPTQKTAIDANGTIVSDISYSYATNGGAEPADDRFNVQSRTSHREEGIQPGAITAYGYDSLNRVVSAIETFDGSESASWEYEYDSAGNRTKQTRAGETGQAAGAIDYTFNAANQLTGSSADSSTWEYDAAGNQTKNGITGAVTSYGDRRNVTEIGGLAALSMGPGNTDQYKIGSDRAFFSGPLGLVAETGPGGALNQYIRSAEGDSIWGLVSGTPVFYTTDNLGSVVGLFDSEGEWIGGYSYAPYGETRAETDKDLIEQNRIKYIGGYEEADGLYKLGARYYDTDQGRFTQMDPSGQEKNPYAYGACNPINSVDTAGLMAMTCGGAIFQGVASVAGVALSTAGLVAGAATLAGGFIAAVSFIGSVNALAFSVGGIIQTC